ncbi:MAG: hypothetical protein M3R14_04520 [Acidobacteriota bacterium]|nr:hypothetical protein [Acidobacteriota bacterium]
MTKLKFVFSTVVFVFVLLLSLTDSFAQSPAKIPAEPSFDVILQTVVASNNPIDKSDIPQSLSVVIKKLRADFLFSNYRLTSIYMQRVANLGNVEFKGVSNETNQNQDKSPATFSDWSLVGLENLLDEKGQATIQIQKFRFGQRVPIIVSSTVTYESVGFTTKFSLTKNVPTVIGSVTTATPDELMFVILTVKSAEQ